MFSALIGTQREDQRYEMLQRRKCLVYAWDNFIEYAFILKCYSA